MQPSIFHDVLPHTSVGKESACNAGDPGSIPGLGRSPGEGNSNSLQYSCLENPMDREVCQATVHGVTIVGHNHHHHTAYKFNKHSNNIEP